MRATWRIRLMGASVFLALGGCAGAGRTDQLPNCPGYACETCEGQKQPGCHEVCGPQGCVNCTAFECFKTAVDCNPFCGRDAGSDAGPACGEAQGWLAPLSECPADLDSCLSCQGQLQPDCRRICAEGCRDCGGSGWAYRAVDCDPTCGPDAGP